MNKQVAVDLDASERTIKMHRANLMPSCRCGLWPSSPAWRMKPELTARDQRRVAGGEGRFREGILWQSDKPYPTDWRHEGLNE